MNVNWKRVWLTVATVVLLMILYSGGRHLAGVSFPAEELQEDGSFRSYDIGFWNRNDIYNAVREKHAGRIRLVIYAHFAFHVFDRDGKVYVVDFGESGAEPPACVIAVESYSGDPHKHAFLMLGGA